MPVCSSLCKLPSFSLSRLRFPPSCLALDALCVIDETSCSTLLLFSHWCAIGRSDPTGLRCIPSTVRLSEGTIISRRRNVLFYLPRPLIKLASWFAPPDVLLSPACDAAKRQRPHGYFPKQSRR